MEPSGVPVPFTDLFSARFASFEGATTVTTLVPINEPSSVVTVIVTDPTDTEVTNPLEFTDATDELLEP